MLDADTKRRIDTARDILVGKVPDPKSQVEQITIALIYKFMDDIDAESEELGGERTFFSGDFARYGWAKLMHPGLGGHETLNLYADGIDRMPENPGIPPLFRDILNNAYLPYRDPETLRAFLKVIDEFTYDHSERLGDAFEYLLSVLGSQGDAGQFRTPRHIIDFIVSIVDPKKDEVVLDPACGTAGFLISSYKHILDANIDEEGNSTLTPGDRERLAANFQGYDISPDMVRLSLVNMYLHGFVAPHIFEYDTLTSDDRWDEYADVILANPPFMSPKGGIRPHSRFSIGARRSEVLFVDYMAEHLVPAGRAGIIVPEGIIFQSQKAHKQLRKMLVEEYLVAVVSLPAGVFNPYSGVKTSILVLDKALAAKSDRIAFFKVENDGFDLGAQRRPIDRNDLPRVGAEVAEYLDTLRAGEPAAHVAESSAEYTAGESTDKLGLLVEKDKVAADGEYNLSGEQYRENGPNMGSFPLAAIGDVCLINPRRSELADLGPTTSVSFVPMVDLNEQQMTFIPRQEKILSEVSASYTYFRNGDVLLAKVTPCFENGKAGVARGLSSGVGFGSSEFYVLRPSESALSEWIYFCVTHSQFRESCIAQMTGTGGLQRVPRGFLEQFQIPLPPLEVQKEIVAEIKGYQKVIDGARAVVDNYRPHITIDPEWPMVRLAEVIQDKLRNGYSGKPVPFATDLKVLSLSATTSGVLDISHYKYLDEKIPLDSPCRCRRGDIYLQRGNTKELVGTAAIFDIDEPNLVYPDLMIRVRADETKILSHFLLTVLQSDSVRDHMARNAVGAAGSMPKINQKVVQQIPIPLPPIAIQEATVAEIEAERALVDANRELIERFEKKIQDVIARMWGG